jgi:chromosomal replication initiator protein
VASAALHDDPASIWERVREQLEASLPTSTFQLWIEPLRPVSVQGKTLYVAAPDAARTWVARRYDAVLEASLRASARGLERVVLVPEGRGPGQVAGDEEWTANVESLPLDPAHTFEGFVIGSGNRLAHSAALAVAELPGEAYNPLFLHGPPGLGKTHLLGAIVDYLQRQRPELTVHYTTAERFTTEFVTALRKHGPERFKRRYRKLDALLIDDVQALEGKEHTQEEFVHTFNALHAAGKQIVLSSDRPPDALARLAERLRDRFGWGLCVELDLPDFHTRTALLWRMTLERPAEQPEPAALKELARRAAGNVRRLQGAMTRVAALSSMLSEPITPSLVRRALDPPATARGAPAASAPRAPDVRAIQDAVCSALGIAHEDLLSPKRSAPVSRARQLAIYLARDLTPLSLAEIAREFNRDHSTVLHSIRSVSSRLEPDSDTSAVLHQTRTLLRERQHHLPPAHLSTHEASSSLHGSSTSQSPAPAP